MTSPVETHDDRPKVVILGGGMAGVTAACRLSEGDWRDRFSGITIVQQGWRLGGKGASGRNRAFDNQIEEHGLHVWFGYYENSFRLLQRCHAELDSMVETRGLERWSTAMTDIGHGFRPVSDVTIMEDESGEWMPWVASFAEDDLSPWDRNIDAEPADWTVPWLLGELVRRAVPLMRTLSSSVVREHTARPTIDIDIVPDDDLIDRIIAQFAPMLDRADAALTGLTWAAEMAARWVGEQIETGGEPMLGAVDTMVGILDRWLDAARHRFDGRLADNAALRRLWCVTDIALTTLRGLASHRVVDSDGLDALDEWDFRDWLDLHGALDISLNSSVVRCLVYDLPFAYEDGDRRRPNVGAGTAIRLLFRTFFTYRGAVMWKMNAGMGDVVFAPLCELLVKRGVEIEFFHQVTDICMVGDDRHIRIRRQRADDATARRDDTPRGAPVDVGNDDSLAWRDRLLTRIDVPGDGPMPAGTLWCWPSAPLEDSAGTADEELEQWPFGAGHGTVRLELDAHDIVVNAMPIGTLPFAAPSLHDEPMWAAAAEHVKTVATMGLQLWVPARPVDLGFADDSIACGFSEPLDTYSHMRWLGPQEGRPVDDAVSVVYLCSVLPDQPLRDSYQAPVDDPAAAPRVWMQPQRFPVLTDDSSGGGGTSLTTDVARWRLALQATATRFEQRFLIDRAPRIWPAAETNGHLVAFADAAVDQTGRRRYMRLNIDPSERYVLSVAGSSRYRIDPANTGVRNLYAAGDWTKCVLNIGCIESATISGLLAADAILAATDTERRQRNPTGSASSPRPGHPDPIIGFPNPTVTV